MNLDEPNLDDPNGESVSLPLPEDSPELEQALRDPKYVEDLISQIKESADKLATDQTSRGDLKILNPR